jgi:Ca2+-binding EF-hand superfamily protein
MKSNTKLFLCVTLFLVAFSNSVKVNSKAKLFATAHDAAKTGTTPAKTADPAKPAAPTGTTTPPVSETGKGATYVDLVTSVIRPKCPIVLDPKASLRDAKKFATGTYPTQGPYVQTNPFKIMSSKDTSYMNYLWDYMDEMVIKKMDNKKITEIILKKFSDSFEDAKKMSKVDLKYSNPYTAPKLLFYFSKGSAGTEPFTDPRLISQKAIANSQSATPSGMVPAKAADALKPTPDDAPVPEDVYKTITSFNKNFDKDIFENGVTPIQVYHILQEWNWDTPGSDMDIMDVKKIVDTYDFNGDGNLNPEEFTIFQIHYTIKMAHQCKKHCFREIIDTILEPLFMYLDCDSDGYINSENLWGGLKYIFRKDSTKYNMYGCKFPLELNKDYRTNTVNDFILKATYAADGFLTKNEFIKGILAGFWERETTEKAYGANPEKISGLAARWSSNGEKDTECIAILYYFTNQ